MPPKRPMESARHPAREIVHLTPSDDQERRHYEIPRRATFERANLPASAVAGDEGSSGRLSSIRTQYGVTRQISSRTSR